ncbi:MAG: PAS domain S-box protein [Deltaproteobacteria bacterium]|nr:PAS domain S-box protein [Deltaproteobacteria bacterium]
MTLRTKTSLLLACTVVLAVTLTGYFYLQLLQSTIRKSIFDKAEDISGATASAIAVFLDDTLRDAQVAAATIPSRVLEEWDVAEIERRLSSMMKLYPKFENGLFVLDSKGTLQLDYPPHHGVRGRSFEFREYFKRTMKEGKGIIGIPYRSARTGEPVLTFTAPLRRTSGEIIGLLGCSVKLLSDQALGGIGKKGFGESGYVYVFDTSRLNILHTDKDRVLERDVPPGANNLFDAAVEGFEGTGETVDSQGIHMLVSLKRVPESNWIVGVQQTAEEAFAPIREARLRIALFLAIGVLVAFLAGTVVIRRITYPLFQLRRAAMSISAESLETPKPVGDRDLNLWEKLDSIRSGDEIGELAQTLKEMYEKLGQTLLSLKRSAKDWERTFDSVPEAIFILDKQNNVRRLNRAAANLLRMDFREAIGRHCYKLFRKDDSVPDYCPDEGELKDKKPAVLEVDEPSLGGIFRMIITPLTDDAGNSVGAVLVLSNITAAKRAEEALRESELRYRSLFLEAQDALFLIKNKAYIDCNPAAERLFRCSREEMLGSSPVKFFPEFQSDGSSSSDLLNTMDLADFSGHPLRFEWMHKAKGGHLFDAEVSISRVYIRGEATFLMLVRDITEQKHVREILMKEQKRLASILDGIPLPTIMIDRNHRVLFWNRSSELTSGVPREKVLNQPLDLGHLYNDQKRPILANLILDLTDEELLARYGEKGLRKIEESPEAFGTVDRIWTNGKERVVALIATRLRDAGGEVVGAIQCAQDITEREQLQQKLQQVQRIEALATLAGGIAHDFNNLLMAIQGHVSLMLVDTSSSARYVEKLKSINRLVRSGAELTRQLLGFARAGKYDVRPLSINELIEYSSDMFGRTRREIEIHKQLEPNAWTVEADRGQIEQVLLNIYVNAWQAMPDGGKLLIRTESVTVHADTAQLWGLRPGRYLKIVIADTGIGMDEGTLKRIFDPFFTTKERGRGTGLGLASAYGIIKNHGGYIDVASQKGKGSSFTIYLPASGKPVSLETKGSDVPQKGTETILFVDDEMEILEVGEQILRTLGYRPLVARNGAEALDIYRDNMSGIDLVILDMIMPGMSGGETHDALKKMDPRVKVLLCSGYSLDGQANEILKRGCDGFLQKPFDITTLSIKLREILSAKTVR